jgi:hypothetical protein
VLLGGGAGVAAHVPTTLVITNERDAIRSHCQEWAARRTRTAQPALTRLRRGHEQFVDRCARLMDGSPVQLTTHPARVTRGMSMRRYVQSAPRQSRMCETHDAPAAPSQGGVRAPHS